MSTVAGTSLRRAGNEVTSPTSHVQTNNALSGRYYSWWETGQRVSDKTLGPPSSDTPTFHVMAYDVEGKKLCSAAAQYCKSLGDTVDLRILTLLLSDKRQISITVRCEPEHKAALGPTLSTLINYESHKWKVLRGVVQGHVTPNSYNSNQQNIVQQKFVIECFEHHGFILRTAKDAKDVLLERHLSGAQMNVMEDRPESIEGCYLSSWILGKSHLRQWVIGANLLVESMGPGEQAKEMLAVNIAGNAKTGYRRMASRFVPQRSNFGRAVEVSVRTHDTIYDKPTVLISSITSEHKAGCLAFRRLKYMLEYAMAELSHRLAPTQIHKHGIIAQSQEKSERALEALYGLHGIEVLRRG